MLSMARTLVERFVARLRAAHKEEGGAIAIAALAGLLILFMMGLTLYDAGKVTREKIKVETASDTAAYSHAAIKARTMNMVNFTNIAKRHTLATHMVHMAAHMAYWSWIWQRCSKCCKWPWCWRACIDCAGGTALNGQEALIDLLINGQTGKFGDVLEGIEKYQSYMIKLTPWWAMMEGMYTGTRNGGSISVSFPPPPGVVTGLLDTIDRVLTILRGSGLYPQTRMKDKMPLEKRGRLRTCTLDATMAMALEDPLAVLELLRVVDQQRSRSSGRPFLNSKGPKDFANAYSMPFDQHKIFGLASAVGVCALFLGGKGGAYEPTPRENERSFKNSNLQLTYKNMPALNGSDRAKYRYMRQEYRTSLTRMEKPNGVWALTRGEYFSKGKPTPWHTNWTARLRPVAPLDSGASMNKIYHDVLPSMGIQALLGLLGGMDLGTTFSDLVYFEKISRAMDPGTEAGFIR
jgi:hypothetical protein